MFPDLVIRNEITHTKIEFEQLDAFVAHMQLLANYSHAKKKNTVGMYSSSKFIGH